MKKNTRYLFFLLMAAVALAVAVSPFASPWPDGLERVAANKGFLEKGEIKPVLASPIPGYLFPWIKNEKVATSVAGVLGTLVVFGLGYGVAWLAGRRRAEKTGGL